MATDVLPHAEQRPVGGEDARRVQAARALALLRGRTHATHHDVRDLAPDVLRHRLVLSYDALADDIPADQIVDRVLGAVPLPTVAPRQNAAPSS